MRFFKRLACVAALAAATSSVNSAGAQEHGGVGPHMFANQYTQGYANQATAKMYISPVPVPERVGHTYHTYEPLYPHEMTYWHTHRYHSYYDGNRGLNRTRVHYYSPPVRTFVSGVHNFLSIPRPQ